MWHDVYCFLSFAISPENNIIFLREKFTNLQFSVKIKTPPFDVLHHLEKYRELTVDAEFANEKYAF